MHPTRFHNESGQGMLELALCLPLFVLLILGAAELGNIAWMSVQINNAAHAGAQFASLSHANAANQINSPATIGTIQLAVKNDLPASLASIVTFPTLPTQACACIDSTGNPTTWDCTKINTTTCPSPSVIQDVVTVNVQATVTPFVHFWGLPATVTLTGNATTPVVNQ